MKMVMRPHMRKVRAIDTTPELKLRKILQSLGRRSYRTHYDKLRGKPDIVFVNLKKVIFVHGCFWHGHSCRAGQNVPRTNQEYWIPKLSRNKIRDRRTNASIRRLGWHILTVWECQLKNQEAVERRVKKFLCV